MIKDEFEQAQNRAGKSLHDVFRDLCFKYAQLGARAGVKITPFRGQTSEKFKTLSPKLQSEIVKVLGIGIRIAQVACDKGVDMGGDKLSLVWWGLRELGLRPKSDLFSQLGNNDIIEIYNSEHIQLFRTFNMFECVSYSLDELFTHEWWELFRRDDTITQALIDVASGLVTGRFRETIKMNHPAYLVEENFSPLKTRVVIETRLASPLFQAGNNNIGGYISVTRMVRILEDGTPEPPRSSSPKLSIV